MTSLMPFAMKPSASLLTLTKPKSSDYTCYFAECWAPSCPTHGVAHRHPPEEMLVERPVAQTEQFWSPTTVGSPQTEVAGPEMCLTPPGSRLTRSITTPDGIFRCYAPTCEAANCPRHKHIEFPESPPQAYDMIRKTPHPTVAIPVPLAFPCPELTYESSPSSASSTESGYLSTPILMNYFPIPVTMVTPDLDEESPSPRSSLDTLTTLPYPPSIIVEPPSVRSSLQSFWSVRVDDTDGYDGSSEMEGIPRRRERMILGPPSSMHKHKCNPSHRTKGKENIRPANALRHRATERELRNDARAGRQLLV